MKRWRIESEMHTLPCSFNLLNVSDSPTVGAEVRAAMGVNLLTERVGTWEGQWRWSWFWGFFKWRKPMDFRATAIWESLMECAWWIYLLSIRWKGFLNGQWFCGTQCWSTELYTMSEPSNPWTPLKAVPVLLSPNLYCHVAASSTHPTARTRFTFLFQSEIRITRWFFIIFLI